MSKKQLINITKNAWNKINKIVESQNAIGFLFTAESGGCNGFNYKLELIDDDKYKHLQKNNKLPLNVLENNNSKVVLEPLSEMFLMGTKIDYVRENFSEGIFENKFIFLADKNIASSCGCGVSFSPK